MEKSRAPSSDDQGFEQVESRLPGDVLVRAVEAAEAQEHGVLEDAGPRESPAQGILRLRFLSDRRENED